MRRSLVLTMGMMVILALAAPASAAGSGATQIEAVGLPGFGVCDDPEGAGSNDALVLNGDLVGCLYQTIEADSMRPSGTVLLRGTEVFVGCLADGTTCGTFGTTFVFTAKFQDGDFAQKVFGRCQHPITAGSGTGDFAGVTGRLDFKDDVAAGTFAMRGHIKLP